MTGTDFPALEEISQLTHSELNKTQDDGEDDIIACGRACNALLATDPQTCLDVAYQHLHAVPYKDVQRCWRRLYVDAALRLALDVLEAQVHHADKKATTPHIKPVALKDDNGDAQDWITQIVKILDMALILTGAPAREELIELWFTALEGFLAAEQHHDDPSRPAKRLKLDDSRLPTPPPILASAAPKIPETFPSAISTPPSLRHPIPRAAHLTLSAFQKHVASPSTQTPLIISHALDHWPALHERPWSNPSYLLARTLGGRRLVPVEIGRSYTDDNWGQKILSFSDFLSTYMLHSPAPSSKKGYLAQHDLFAQIPALRADISIPDYCYCEPGSAPRESSSPSAAEATAKLESPLLNAWFGPEGTISPLHTDPYHNILAQVVGYKYVRLYPPGEGQRMYPRGTDERGVDMSNTSEVDLDEAMRVWPWLSCGAGKSAKASQVARDDEDNDEGEEEKREWTERFAGFKDARYVEGVLAPGECLYIPVGWWHYVRSLTPSFSVSFWFN